MNRKIDATTNYELAKSNEALELGKVYHISTVQFAYRGTLVAVTPDYYVLRDATNVFDTGPLKAYMTQTFKGSSEEKSGDVLVERTAVAAIWLFPEGSFEKGVDGLETDVKLSAKLKKK